MHNNKITPPQPNPESYSSEIRVHVMTTGLSVSLVVSRYDFNPSVSSEFFIPV